MKLLIVSQYFSPESFIINDLARHIQAAGHEVTVLTGKPNYPQGVIYSGYKFSGVRRENYADAIEVIRVPLIPRGKSSGLRLAINYISFVLSGLLFFPWLVRGKSFDAIVVFAISPITAAIPAILLKWLKGAHLALWIQDLWPESLSATGFIHNKSILRTVGWMVQGIYACSDTLLVQSRAFQKPVSRYSREDKIVYYPNSYENKAESVSGAFQASEMLLDEFNTKFCLVFAGNLGRAQALETLVQAADRLKHLKHFRLVVVGSGSMQAWLEQQKKEKSLDNLILAGRFPFEEMPQIYSRAAGLLVTLKRDEIFSYIVPSKIQAYLSAGRPIIAALDGEGSKIIDEAGAGLTCPAEDVEGLVNCVEKLYAMTEAERETMGKAGRKYFLEHFEMKTQAGKLIEILEMRKKAAKK